ncbi:MAG: cyclic nucleotide-binding/CBS domain-containing protein [Candidatus Eiseniibacteriota bacterium]
MSRAGRTVADIIPQRLETVRNTESVRDVANIMRDNDINSLLVTDSKNEPLGIITERDIVRKVFSNVNRDSSQLVAGDIISSPLITISSKSTPEQACEIFAKSSARHLLVLENVQGVDKPLGIITPLDFIWYREKVRTVLLEDGDERILKILDYYRDLH